MRSLLYVFARAPEAGRVKTRLIPRVGAAGAAALARAFLDDTLVLTRGVADRRVLAIAGDVNEPSILRLAEREGIDRVQQAEGDLGARMAKAILDGARAASHGGELGRVAIVGCDAPLLEARQITHAVNLLDDAHLVLGPAEDGGYWLIGARACPLVEEHLAAILSDTMWSSTGVRATTLERARARGLVVALGEPAFDVDEPADLDRLARALDDGPSRAPATRAALSLVLRSAP